MNAVEQLQPPALTLLSAVKLFEITLLNHPNEFLLINVPIIGKYFGSKIRYFGVERKQR